ncbi:MAG TPA: trypsin-like peptidase domain-containing protein [Isosphaeraceae bacterium]|nr:trypsin-like peptidase domain-containing protein [Isosphaeraceae bacterium]
MPSSSHRRTVAVLALLGLGAIPASGQGEAESLSASFRKAAKRVLPAVVTVRPVGAPRPLDTPPGRGPGLFGPGPLGPGMPPSGSGGSGVVIDAEKGYVLTNDHVIPGAARIEVTLHDGRSRIASQIRRDPKSDLALLVIDPEGLIQADWGDSDALDTGDWVLAVGQPFGLSNTVTAGIVSGKGRGIGMAMYEDLIQTDAAINPGNSGGPLVNLNGEVVGIDTAIKTLGGGYEGVGFAVPAGRARRVAAELAEHGRVRRAYLGIQIGAVDPRAAERLKQPGAVVVNEVTPEAPAAKAALRRGDVIVTLNGKPVHGPGALQAAIEIAPVGEPLTLGIDRDGARREVEVRPQEQPERFGLPDDFGSGPIRRSRPPPRGPLPPVPPEEPGLEVTPPLRPEPPLPESIPPLRPDPAPRAASFSSFGLRLSEPTAEVKRRFGLNESPKGLVIVGIDPDGPADRGGLEPGMVITDAADRRVESLLDFQGASSGRPRDRNLIVRVLKGSKAEYRVLVDRPESVRAGPGGAPRRPPATPKPEVESEPKPGVEVPRLGRPANG